MFCPNRNFTMDIDSDCESDTQKDIADIEAALQSSQTTEDPTIVETELASEVGFFEIAEKALECVTNPTVCSALSLNEAMDTILLKLQESLNTLLHQCDNKLQQVQTLVKESRPMEAISSGYFQCGIPFFKDKYLFSSPPNIDTKKFQQLNVLNYVSVARVRNWTIADKKTLESLVVDAIRAKEKKNLEYEIRRIDRNMLEESKTSATTDEYTQLEKLLNTKTVRLNSLLILDYKELVPPLGTDEGIDWDDISSNTHLRHNTEECRAMWRLYMHPSINKQLWSETEERRLLQLASTYRFQDWEAVAQRLNTGRTGYQCFVFYRMHLSAKVMGLRWTREEDQYLESVIDSCRIGDYIPWAKVTYYMENKTKEQVYNRWTHSLKFKRKGRFSNEEDAVVMAAVEEYGEQYKRISFLLPGRTCQQIRSRYLVLSTMKPVTIWTLSEDKLLVSLISRARFNDASLNYSMMTKHFEDKSRANIRMRALTLEKWFKSNPGKGLASAPRRRVIKTQTKKLDLKTALEMFHESVKKSKTAKRCEPRKPLFTFSYAIDSKFISYFKNSIEKPEPFEHQKPPVINLEHLKDLLLLLNAKLSRPESIPDRYDALPAHIRDLALSLSTLEKAAEPPKLTSGVRTYSRKKKPKPDHPQNCTATCNDFNIWSSESAQNDQSVNLMEDLPPNFSSITAFKEILIQKYDITRTLVERYSKINVESTHSAMKLWTMRFNSLLTWPAFLSNITPNVNLNLFEENQNIPLSSKEYVEDIDALVKENDKNVDETPFMIGSGRVHTFRMGSKRFFLNHSETPPKKKQKVNRLNVENFKAMMEIETESSIEPQENEDTISPSTSRSVIE